ncbi:ABC transporter substrate-binding protein [Celerinatantimonas sp. MCCC 1A17872]|uniref:ABC transporter substrate-binding protein n=1 Tax=Celerinatantimonas sp. MCCC 1A17872 TaxID=3177514 RepID=UPI0038BFC50A
MKFKHIALCLALAEFVPVLSHAATNDLNLISASKMHFLMNPIYPPMEYHDAKTGKIVGFDVDISQEIAHRLGKKPMYVSTAFSQLQSSLLTHRGDLIISGMSDNPKREKTMDFVDYVTSGPVFFTLKKNAGKYASELALCGKTVAASRSTTFGQSIMTWSKANCDANGKTAIHFEGTEDSSAARLGMKQGRYDAVVQGIETMAYQMKLEPNEYKMIGKPMKSNDIYGIGIPKNNPELRAAVVKTLNAMIADGTYTKILDKWGLTTNGVKTAQVNGAGK